MTLQPNTIYDHGVEDGGTYLGVRHLVLILPIDEKIMLENVFFALVSVRPMKPASLRTSDSPSRPTAIAL